MYNYGIGALQPKQDAFDLENAAHQAKLSNSVRHCNLEMSGTPRDAVADQAGVALQTMVSSLCSNWWRIEGNGRISVGLTAPVFKPAPLVADPPSLFPSLLSTAGT